MELQLKHIAPYFPYDLKCQYSGMLSGQLKTGVLQELTYRSASFEHRMYWSFTAFKPILKPIYWLDETYAAKLVEFIGTGWCEAYDEYFEAWFKDLGNTDKLVLQAPQPIFNYFLSQHFDVFGLISKGLAMSESGATK